MTNVWESDYIEVAYDKVLSNSSIYLKVRDFHINAMNGCVAVLDSGCGTGSVAVELLERGAVVYAVDTSRTALEVLQRKCEPYKDRLHVYNTTAEHLPFSSEMFDGITSMFVVHFMDDFNSYLREHFRVLKKGGVFALTGRTRGTKEDMSIIADSYEDDLRRAEKLKEEKYRKVMDIMRERMLSGVGPAVKHGYTAEQMIEILRQIGFVDIQEHPNPYFGQCYSLTGRKK